MAQTERVKLYQIEGIQRCRENINYNPGARSSLTCQVGVMTRSVVI